jgi:LPS-assembly lipoprotein
MAVGRRGLLALAGVGTLAGCGFHPLYAPNAAGAVGGTQKDLAAIAVGIIPNRNGQELRQALQARFTRQGLSVMTKYDLAVALAIGGDAVGIEQDSSVTHIRLIGIAYYVLTSQNPPRPVLTQGMARQLDGYDLVNEQFFASDLANDFAQKRIAEALADQITQRLAVFFDRRAAAPG